MKKIIFITLLSIIVPTLSWAVNSCSAIKEEASCKATKGCYWGISSTGNSNECYTCPNYYGPFEEGTITCAECWGELGNGVKFDSDDENYTASNNNCKWTATCGAGEYFKHWRSSFNGCQKCALNSYGPNKIITYSGTTNSTTVIMNGQQSTLENLPKCSKCGENAILNPSTTNCNCIPNYHKTGSSWDDNKNVGTANCVANTYTITLYHSADAETDTIDYTAFAADAQNTTETIYKTNLIVENIPYDTTKFSLPESESTRGLSENEQDDHKLRDKFIRPLYVLSKWKAPDNKEYNPYDYYAPQDGAEEKQTIFAVWAPKEFTVTYYYTPTPNTNPTTIITCKTNEECKALDPLNNKPDEFAGKIFNGWTCTIGDKPCSKETVKPNDNLIEISNGQNITLTAELVECPAGFYCHGDKKPCPSGATSEKLSKNITDCYLSGGITTITGTNGTFKLPANLELYYKTNGSK